MSLSLLVATGLPEGGFWAGQAVKFGVAYWGLSVALNVGITLAIAIRLLRMRSKHRGILQDNHTSPYTSVAAMLVESASLYAIWALLFIILYGKGSYVQNYILPSLGQVQARYLFYLFKFSGLTLRPRLVHFILVDYLPSQPGLGLGPHHGEQAHYNE